MPRYCDLLADQDDEDETERGHLLVNSVVGWRMDMARWIGETRAADEAKEADDAGVHAVFPVAAAAWKPITIAALFGGIEKSQHRATRLPPAEISKEAVLMEALAELNEDEIPDKGAIEIDSDNEFIG